MHGMCCIGVVCAGPTPDLVCARCFLANLKRMLALVVGLVVVKLIMCVEYNH